MKSKKIKLKEIAEITMGQSPKGSSYNDKKKGTPFLQGNRTFGRIYPYIDTWTTQPKKISMKNSILMSVRAPVGEINIANQDICIGRGLCSIQMKNNNNIYLYYLLMNCVKQIKKKAIGTVFDAINRKELEEIEVINYNEKYQNKIVKILYSIDRKIELNNKINNKLQEIARTLYEKKFYNKENNNKLKELVNLKKERIKLSNKNSKLDYYPIDTLPMNYLVTQTGKSNSEAKSSLIVFSKFDILLGAMRVYFHRVCLAANDGITRNTTFVFSPKLKEYLYYSLLLLDRDEFIEYASKTSKGSTMPYAVWEVLAEYNVYLPEIGELKEFNKILQPIFNKMIGNEKKNETLKQLRDILLSKLIKGEIDLESIEI